jgi:hypothetical protein
MHNMTRKPKTSVAKPPTRKPTASTKEERYKPTPREQEVLEAHRVRKERHLSPPRVKVTMDGDTAQIAVSHPAPELTLPLVMESLGTAEPDFLDGIALQLANLAQRGSNVNEPDFKFLMAAVMGLEPKDELEAMLAAQMAAVHHATMTFARRLSQVKTIPQQDSAERALNKLARTFAAQVEALKRYRTGGQQKVTVEHVTVNEGGQAIVGHVQGGGGTEKKHETTP